MIIILISNDMAFKWHLNVLFHCHGLDSCGYTGELGFCADHPERSRKHRWITLSFVGSIRPIGNIGGLLTFIKLLGSDFLPWNSTWTVLILIGGLEHLDYFSILGMSSSHLTFIFFRVVAQPPTSIFHLSGRTWARVLLPVVYSMPPKFCRLRVRYEKHTNGVDVELTNKGALPSGKRLHN